MVDAARSIDPLPKLLSESKGVIGRGNSVAVESLHRNTEISDASCVKERGLVTPGS